MDRTSTQFSDRRDAGRALAQLLEEALPARSELLVLALPRGGVPVAWEVARALQAPLDVLVVRKLGFPGQEEYAMGAIASGGVRVTNDGADDWPVDQHTLEAVTAREQAELERRERLYRGERPFPALAGRTVVLVDDGLATGATMRAAVGAVRRHAPARIVVAVPVGARESVAALRAEADEVFCVRQPEHFRAVGLWYQDFDQTSDEEVRRLLGSGG